MTGRICCAQRRRHSNRFECLKNHGQENALSHIKNRPLFSFNRNRRRILTEALQIKTGEFIFAHRGTLTATYYDHIKDTCASAGIIYGRKVVGGLIPYDLRHTATTLIMQSGTDFETASSVTG
jgi:hypothetical protein